MNALQEITIEYEKLNGEKAKQAQAELENLGSEFVRVNNELPVLRARIAELEAENERLKKVVEGTLAVAAANISNILDVLCEDEEE